jgi:transposase-like protein
LIVGFCRRKNKRRTDMTCLRCKHHEAKRFGFYGRKKIQRYRCPGCNATFSEPRQRPLGRHYTDPDKAAQIATLLLEGMSVRAVSRITGAHQGTILSLLLTVGKNCRNLFDKRVRGIRPRFVQADELWTFVHTKERHLLPNAPMECGGGVKQWLSLHIRSPPTATQNQSTTHPPASALFSAAPLVSSQFFLASLLLCLLTSSFHCHVKKNPSLQLL